MIETLRSASVLQEGDPASAHLTVSGIFFDAHDLSRPRYPSLINYERAPGGVQFEPAIQIMQAGPQLHIQYEIDPSQPMIFDAPDGENVYVTSVLNPEGTPPGVVSAKLVDDNDPRRCVLVWDQEKEDEAFGGPNRIVSLRLHCRHSSEVRELSNSPVEKVEGGVYLTILNRPEMPFKIRRAKEPGTPIESAIKILGFDPEGRPVYDLFQPEVLEGLIASLALEPSFRIREGQISSFSMVLDLPPELEKIRFELEPKRTAVRVVGFEPQGRPFQLNDTPASDFGGKPNRKCFVEWYQETGRQYCSTSNSSEATKCYCTKGQVTSFNLRATDGEILSDIMIARGQAQHVAQFDPTVIQPPNCTSQGICITP
jgi:hypothetical protein